ncbi:RND transporter [Flavonifractor sp. An135]|nr:efflux RND transporter periplasmic adaptor subunit [Flavonifractor sp. An135]OUQ22758.1 RND transporter [Flavonifractor sp. An135]
METMQVKQDTEQTELETAAPAFQPPKKKPKWLKWVKRLIALAVVAALVIFLLRSCGGGGGMVSANTYRLEPASMQDLTVSVTGTGTIEPIHSYKVTTLVKGEILEAPFEEGDTVHKGDVLFRIDAKDVENSIQQAQIAVDNAQLSLESARLSYQDLLKNQKDQKKNLQVKATDSGVITKLHVEAGDTLTAGAPIADLLDRDHMKLTVSFHSVDAATFYVGQSATIRVDGTGESLTGTIDSIAATDSVGPGGTLVREVTLMVNNPGALSDTSTGTASVGGKDCASGGTFAYAASAQILAQTSGKLETLTVKEGSHVTKNQVIGSFEETDLATQIENARIAVENAENAVENAQLTLKNAQDSLENYTITSTIDGTVIEKNLDVGDNIDGTSTMSTGTTYPAVIYDLSGLTFDINIHELDINQIQVGQKVEITSQAVDGKTFTGHVDKVNINGVTTSGTTNYPVTIRLDETGELLPGMNVSARIIVEEQGQALCVPIEAVDRENGGTVLLPGPDAVYDKEGNLVSPGTIESRTVTLGRNNDSYIEILDGLSEGEQVLIQNPVGSSMIAVMGG